MNGKTSSAFQRLLAATLLVSGLGAIAAPAFADGTAAGTSIDNTATATYEDPAGTKFNATSNKVTVTVAEVAGVTVTGLSTIDRNGGVIGITDVVDYEFKVTNVGNDTTEFYIPGTPSVVGPATATQVFISGYYDPAGNRVNFPSPILVSPGTAKTSLISGLPAIPGSPAGVIPAGVIPAGYSLIVNVPTTINNTATSGTPVTVQLGNTGTNDNSPATQNQNDITDGPLANEVRTVDYIGETGPSAGLVADEKEASGTQTVKVGSLSQALATILKTRTSYVPNLPNTLNDDVIGYGLGLKVESAAPAGSLGITPGKLVGTSINVNNTVVNRVLVSDAVPVLTKLTSAADVLTPNGTSWTAVYTTTPVATSALAATWSTTFNADATRIGFIYDATTTPLAEGSDITGFGFKVVTSGIIVTDPVNVLNIAQVFGQTENNTGPTAPLVYDESGDKYPSNFDDNGSSSNPPTLTPGSTIPSGIPNATNDGIDNNNNNTGVGPNGEDNVTTIALAGSILNGPSGFPSAVGPTDNNDDFTNRSTAIPAGTIPGATIDPDPITFTNTLSNPTGAPLTDVLLVPDVARFTAAGDRLPPTGTIVTLFYGNVTSVYIFNGTNFIFTAAGSTGSITIPTLAANQSVSYDVKVDLPPSTPLSTDTGEGFSIPIFAFKDVNGDGRPGTLVDEPTQNRTINRVYTGFLRLVKEARILAQDGTTEIQTWTQLSAALVGKGARGRFIEYRISYRNISIAPTGTGNVTLDARNIAIIEDGANTTNSWAKDTDSNNVIDTSHVIGSVSVTYGGLGSVIFSPSGEQTGTTALTDVTKYVHSPGVVIQPQANGTFIFKRKIN